MYLRSLYLKNFRIYDEVAFDFSPQINMIWGANARGKTTILEAIHYLITGRSFRSSQPSDLIRAGESYFYIEGIFVKHGIEQRLKVSYDGKERKIVYNSTNLQSATHLLGLLQGVLHTPDDVALVKGSPSIRRHFLDLQIAQADPLYVHHLTRYNQAMRQRNQLLRAKNVASIHTWEHEMANASAYIVTQRNRVISELNASAIPLHDMLVSHQEPLLLGYTTSANPKDSLEVLKQYHLNLFQRNRKRELDLGLTLGGPHKDDLSISLCGKDVRQFASEGQQRSFVSTLKIAEWSRLKAEAEDAPLMLIDDLGISLDPTRRKSLLNHLTSLDQVFLTFTQPTEMDCDESQVRLLEIV